MQDRECIAFEWTRDTDQRIHELCVCVCVSRAHPVFNQSSGGSFSSYTISVAFAHWKFVLLHATKKNNNAAKFFASLKQNNSEGFTGTP